MVTIEREIEMSSMQAFDLINKKKDKVSDPWKYESVREKGRERRKRSE
jgi:hypothetical protein